MNKKALFTYLGLLFFACFSAVFSQGVSLDVQPPAQIIERGQATSYLLNVTPSGGFSQQVFGSVDWTDLPGSVQLTLTPNALNAPYTGGISLMVDVPGGTPLGTYTIVLKVANGSISALDTVTLEILEEPCPWIQHPDFSDGTFQRDITIDQNGDLWTAGAHGLRLYNGVLWTEYASPNFPIPNGGVHDVLTEPATNDILMSSLEGLLRFDRTFWTLYDTATSAIPGNRIKGLAVDSSGNVWCSTASSNDTPTGIGRFDGNNWTTFNTQNSGLISDNAGRIEVDRQGNVWVVHDPLSGQSPYYPFLSKFDGNTWTVYTSANSCLPSSNSLNGMAFDLNNHLWMSFGSSGTANPVSGLFRFGGGEWEVWNGKNYSNYNHVLQDSNCNILVQDNSSLLPGSSGFDVFGASDGTIWVAGVSDVVGLGEGAIAITNQTWRIFNTSNSNLFGNAIGGFAEDQEGDIWATVDENFYDPSGQQNMGEFVCDLVMGAIEETRVEPIKMQLYPNPTADKLHFRTESGEMISGQITLRDQLGRVVLRGQGRSEIEVAEFTSGMYYLEIVAKRRVYLGRFVKK